MNLPDVMQRIETSLRPQARLKTGMEDWSTPQSFFDSLDREFGFTLDACATNENAKCLNYFTRDDDGLAQSWAGHRVWMNPPYGVEIPKWMRKAYEESQREALLVVCLVPARTDTRWWHDYAEKGEKRFVKGRLKFMSVNGPLRLATASVIEGRHAPNNSAPFPSALVVFRNPKARMTIAEQCDDL